MNPLMNWFLFGDLQCLWLVAQLLRHKNLTKCVTNDGPGVQGGGLVERNGFKTTEEKRGKIILKKL